MCQIVPMSILTVRIGKQIRRCNIVTTGFVDRLEDRLLCRIHTIVAIPVVERAFRMTTDLDFLAPGDGERRLIPRLLKINIYFTIFVNEIKNLVFRIKKA